MNISAVLLTGGNSRRMGQDKATLPLQGKPLWEIQLETLRKLKPTELFVSARSDPEWRPHDVLFVADVPPSQGPLSGLAASLDRMNASHLLALAIDMPWMSSKYLKRLCAQIEPGCGVVPKIGGRFEPVAAIYPQEAAFEFRAALRGADFSLQSLTRDLVASGRLREISVSERDNKLFLNANAPSDLLSG